MLIILSQKHPSPSFTGAGPVCHYSKLNMKYTYLFSFVFLKQQFVPMNWLPVKSKTVVQTNTQSRDKFRTANLASCPNRCCRWIPRVGFCCAHLLTCSLQGRIFWSSLMAVSTRREQGKGGDWTRDKGQTQTIPLRLLSDNDKHNEDPLRLPLSFSHYEHSSFGICHRAHRAWHSRPFTRGNMK